MSCGWANASACCLQITLYCAVLCQIVSLQYLSRSSFHRLAGLPCHLLLYGLQVVILEVHWLSLWQLICPAHDHFIHCNAAFNHVVFIPFLNITNLLELSHQVQTILSNVSCSCNINRPTWLVSCVYISQDN